jgi:hypothetical protein
MKKFLALAATSLLVLATPALAGPFILDGTDADDHGFASSGANQAGWLYIQKALQNIAASSSLTKTQKSIAVLGGSSDALTAAQSAVALSALSGAGWTVVGYSGAAAINAFFSVNTNTASVLYIPSDGVSGGLDTAEEAALTTNAANINSFVGAGGGLFSMGHSYGWLGTLVPGLTASSNSNTGITLTAAGNAAFPSLTNADLSSGPYHYAFSNTGSIPILGTGVGGSTLIIGAAGGSVTAPQPTGGVPEPSTWLSMLAGFGAMGFAMRRGTQQTRVRFAL